MDDVERMADWLVSQLTTLGVKSEKRDIGTHELAGKQVKLPSVVIGQIGNDPKKVSLRLRCRLGHIADGLENSSCLRALRCPASTKGGWMAP